MASSVNQCNRRRKAFKSVSLIAVLMLVGVTGCEETVHVRGNVPHSVDIAKIKKGFHKKRDIENILGTPSAVATFKKETWYYIGGRVKTVSFFRPEVLDRKVLVIHFNDRGVVDAVEARDVPIVEDIKLVERETPTKGKELTILQQLIGNIGRFSTGDQQNDNDIF